MCITYVAGNPNASADLIRSLYASALDGSCGKYNEDSVILADATNPNTPEDIFYELAKRVFDRDDDDDDELLSALKHNPSVPADLHEELSHHHISAVSRIIVCFSDDPSGENITDVCTSVIEAAGYKIYDEWFDEYAEDGDEYRIYCELVTSNYDADKIDSEIRYQLTQRGVTVDDIDWDVEENWYEDEE